MTDRPARLKRLATWYEQSTRPGLILTIVVIFLYAPWLAGGFKLDDHRCMRVLREFRDGLRDAPAVYDFLRGDAGNAAERMAGNYAWWLYDGVRYRHLRPVSEWLLYGEYRLFGPHPLGYHLVSLGIYSACVLVLLGLYRLLAGDEILARWAAMIFAITASHAIPVIFLSAQCDLLALLCVVTAVFFLTRFIRFGGGGRFFMATLAFITGLGCKEAAFPAVAAPLLLLVLFRADKSVRQRALLASAVWLAIGVSWLMWYSAHGYGANTAAMLEPLKDPAGYLRLAPLRAVILLCTWVIVINPFLMVTNSLYSLTWVYIALGLGTILFGAVQIWKSWRQHPAMLPMILWPLLFMPVLACTPPDDRVMMLPGIGLSLLAAMWLKPSRMPDQLALEYPTSDAPRFRRFAVCNFLMLQPLIALVVAGIFNFMEFKAQNNLRIMAAQFQRPMNDHDCIFIVNTSRTVDTLFTQDRLHYCAGPGHATVLGDVSACEVTRVDNHTLRMRATDEPILSTFLGKMGVQRDRPPRVGDVLQAREFEARITDVRDGNVHAVEFNFRDGVESDRYRFFRAQPLSPPIALTP